MDTEVTKIQNALNFYKRTKILVETCTRTMMIVYKFVYKWTDNSPHKLADHLDEIPNNQTKSLKNLLKTELAKIEAMKNDENLMKGYDITFFFKLIQFAVNNAEIKPANDEVWSRNCHNNRKNELEYLLYLIKNDRNEFSHKEDKFLNLKDEDNELYFDILVVRLPLIIQEAGIRGNINQTVIKEACDNLLKEIESIRDMKDISPSDEKPILKLMVEKYLLPGLIKLNECFSNELKSYCPPNFQLENRIMSTEELLSDGNMQVICIRGEAGFGKTSFTKFVQRELLLKIEKAGDDLASHEIPIQIACRDIIGSTVTEFLEYEIPILKSLVTSFSSLKECLAHFDIRWIIDGYDEKPAGFSKFFQSLLKTLPDNHKIIITLRPNYQKEIEDEWNSRTVCNASIKCFDVLQIKDVSVKFLGSDESSRFTSSIQKLNVEMRDFMKTPINLIQCLELWSNDHSIFHGDRTTVYQLHDFIFEKLRTLLVDRHKDKTNRNNKDDLKNHVSKWFCDLCKIIAESPFGYELNISESQKEKLQVSASNKCLQGNYCLSMFFICEKSSTGMKYFIKHKTQKEVLVCHYLKKCEHKDLEAVAEQDEIYYLLERKKPFNIFKFLTECCSKWEFSTIFGFYFKMYSLLQRPGCLLQIKREKEEYFDAFKKTYSGKLVLNVNKDDDPTDLINVIQYLSTDIESFKLVLSIGDGTEIAFYSNINEVLSKYHDFVELELAIIVSEETVDILDIFKDHKKLIKEIIIESARRPINWPAIYLGVDQFKLWIDLKMLNAKMKNILSLENLQTISIAIDASRYLDSFVHYLVSPLVFVSYKSCHAHFIIKKIENPSEVINDLLKVFKVFHSISVDFELRNHYIKDDIKKGLLLKFKSSDVQLKQLDMGLAKCCHDFIWTQFVNCKTIETLNVDMRENDEMQSLDTLKNFFEVLKFAELLKLKEISFEITDQHQMKILLEEIPPTRFNETVVKVHLDPTKWLSVVKNTIENKKFKKLEILRCGTTVSLGQIHPNIIQFFTSSTKSLIIYGVPHSNHVSNITKDEQKIKDVAMKYMSHVETEDFLYWYRSLNDASKMLMKIQSIVKLCLQTWIEYQSLPKIRLTAHNLFEKSIDSIVEFESRDGGSKCNKDDLEKRVNKWFDHFCKVVTRIMFTTKSEFTKFDEDEMMQAAKVLDLDGNYCLSSFLIHVESSTSVINYLFKNDIEKESLAIFGLKISDVNVLDEIVNNSQSKCIDDFAFLLEWGDSFEFVRVFSLFLKKDEDLISLQSLINIKDKNEDCFDALMKKICAERVYLDLYSDSITLTEKINDIVNKYKDDISFHFNLKLIIKYSKDFIPGIQILTNQGNNNLVKEVDVNHPGMHKWSEEMMKELRKFENLEKVSFYIKRYDCSADLSPAPLCPDLNPLQTLSTTPSPLPMATPSSGLSADLNQSCHIHFNINEIKKPSTVIKDILKVKTKFPFISVDLNFDFAQNHSMNDFDNNLLEKYKISTLQIKELTIKLNDFSKYENLMQLVNNEHLEILELRLWNIESECLSSFKHLFETFDFGKLKNLKKIVLYTEGKLPLIEIYNRLPFDILNKTILEFQLDDSSVNINDYIADSEPKKQFKQIRILNPACLSTSDRLKLSSISKSIVDYGTDNKN